MIININPDLQDLHGKSYERWMAPALFSPMYSGLYDLVIMIDDSALGMADLLIDARETFWKDFERGQIDAYSLNIQITREHLVRDMLIYPEITPGYSPPRLLSERDLKHHYETWIDNAISGDRPHILLIGSPLTLLFAQESIVEGYLRPERVRLVYCSRYEMVYVIQFDRNGQLVAPSDDECAKIFAFSRGYWQKGLGLPFDNLKTKGGYKQ